MGFTQEDFDRLAALARADFEPHVGAGLQVDGQDGLVLELLEVQDPPALLRPPPVAPGQREGFSLLFRGPASPALAQGMHPVLLPGVGRLPLFLVPVQPDGERPCYQAVFG